MSSVYKKPSCDDLFGTASFGGGWGAVAESVCVGVSAAAGTAIGASAGSIVAPVGGTAVGGIVGNTLGQMACDGLDGVNDFPDLNGISG